MDEEVDGNESPDVQESLMGALIGARGVPGGLQGLSAESPGDSSADESGLSAETAELLGISPQPDVETEVADEPADAETEVEAQAEVEPEAEEPVEVKAAAETEAEAEAEAEAEVEVEVEQLDEIVEAEVEEPAEVEAPEPAEIEASIEAEVAEVEAGPNIDDPDPDGIGRVVLEWAVVLVGAVVMALVLRQFIFQAFWIPSESMETTLEIRDRVLVNRLSYQWGEVDRGDVVVFARKPEEIGEIRDLIKRVIGLPGESVEGRDNLIYIDGVLLNEPYVDEDNRNFADFGPVTVPEGELFVMGDNRDQSFDSRLFGTVDQERVAGRAFVTFWPLDRVGSL